MKPAFWGSVLSIFIHGVLILPAQAQGIFQNLDFESAVVVPVPGDPYGRVQLSPAFPGWTGYVGTNQQTLALFNNLFIGTSAIALLGPGWRNGGIIEGNYTAVLQAGTDPGGSLTPVSASISQTGLIPAGSRTIELISTGARNGFTVSLNSQPLNIFVIGTRNGFNIYAGDVSQFAGLTEDLRITAIAAPSSPANLYLDSISFSSQPIPEPRTLALSTFGALLFYGGFRSHKKVSNRARGQGMTRTFSGLFGAIKVASLLSLTFALAYSARSQGTFLNMNFEGANIPTGTQPGSMIPIAAGFPGWSGSYSNANGTVQATQIAYDGISLGGAIISVVDGNSGVNPIQGQYSAFIFGGLGGPSLIPTYSTIRDMR